MFVKFFRKRICSVASANYVLRGLKTDLRQAKDRKKFLATDLALKHFDDFYKNVFGDKWPSIRVALLSPHKYCAVVNNFSDTQEVIAKLQNQGALNIKTLFDIERKAINEKENNKWNKKHAKKIENLDRKLEQFFVDKQREEVQEFYPEDSSEGTDIRLSDDRQAAEKEKSVEESAPEASQRQEPHIWSLKKGLMEAEYDEHRIIDPSLGLTASALHEFVPTTELMGMSDYILDSEHYRYYQSDKEFPVEIQQEFVLEFPKHLQVFTYETGNISSFYEPSRGSTGVSDYYCMDGSSLLPVLALDIQPGDNILDMCAAPGGKSLLMLQTLNTGVLVCNDIQVSRVKRIHSILNEYIYDLEKWGDQIQVTQNDGTHINEQDFFDKILVDVPCTTDRHSVHEPDNNIFKSSRIKERLRIPEMQAALLSNALKLVRPGGTVVYSTCSLSPIQNDGVVHMALRHVWEETKMEFCVSNMSPALEEIESVYRLEKDVKLRYGHLVIPYLPANFGPMYFCKIVRKK